MNDKQIDQTIQSQYDRLWNNEWRNLHKLGPSVRSRNRLLLKYFKKYISSGSVIDIGCGDGQFLLELHRIFCDRLSYVAGDISDQALQAVRSRGFVNDVCVVDVGQKDTLPDSTFSVVVSSEVLEHIEDWKTALKNLTHLVELDGYIFITVPALMKHWGAHDVFAHHFRRFEYGEIETVLKGLDFQIMESLCWGWPFYDLYYTFVLNRTAPESVMKEVNSPLKVLAATILYYLFFLDDLFHTSRGRRFFIIARKKA